MDKWSDALHMWGAMTGLAVFLLVALTAIAWYAHHKATADEDDADLAAELQGRR